ncbi:putative Pol polyprotein [Cricetulus griseus]|nr:putative Pol polyprotein [Cricetulus griseus]
MFYYYPFEASLFSNEKQKGYNLEENLLRTATTLNSEKADSVITNLLEVMAVMGIPAQMKIDNAPAYVFTKMEQFFKYYNIKHVTGIPNNPTGQTVFESSNRTLKEMLHRQAARTSSTILKRYGESGQPCLVPNFREITVSHKPTMVLDFCNSFEIVAGYSGSDYIALPKL